MSQYHDVIKLMDERCAHNKEIVLALATILEPSSSAENFTPVVRMVCAYYEDGRFYISTDATSNKMAQIAKNSEVSISSLDWYSLRGYAQNLGWVKDECNRAIRAKFKEIFKWFSEVGDEDNPNSIVLCITPTSGTVIDNESKYGVNKYEVDFVNKVVH